MAKALLLDAFAAELRAQGVTVLSGRSESDEAAPPYWLWVEVLRGVAASSELSDMLDELGPEGDEVRLILPEPNAGRAERAASWGGEQGRFLLFDAVTRLILSEAERRPLAIALEDLHWAPPGSLRLLEHLVYEMRGRPLLIAAAVRTEPRAMEHPLSRSLGLVGGLDHVEAISLGPLTISIIGGWRLRTAT